MENLIPIIVQLVSGAVGGNVAAAGMKNLSLGTLGNSLVGILGGGLGGQLLGMLGIAAGAGGDMELSSIGESVAAGGVGGGALLAVIGALKKAFAK